MDRRRRKIAGFVFALAYLGVAALFVQLQVIERVAPLISLGVGVLALLFSRLHAIALLLAYLGLANVLDPAPDLFTPESLVQLAFFVGANIGIAYLLDRLRLTLQAARNSERNYHLIANNTSDLILAYDMNRMLLFVNPAVERLLGYTMAEVRRNSFVHWIHPEDEGRMLDLLESAFQGEAFSDIEFRVVTRKGQIRWFAGTWGPLRDEKGSQFGIQGVERDVTERYRMREVLNQNLAQIQVAKVQAEQQAAELSRLNEELRMARDEALEGAQAKSYFLATMSHEIRTPMNGVLGMANLLLETPLNAEQRELAETVLGSGEALLTIINDILDFSKIEAGKLTLQAVDFDLRKQMEEACELLAEAAARKNIEMLCWVEHDVPQWVRGDAGRVRQVLLNLLGNAVKFTERGEVVVKCSLREEDAAGCRLLFEVCDTGIGISPDIQARLFVPFTQADMAASRKYGGTGLGLAISKELVAKMEGSIGLESEMGKGSRFWFDARLAPPKDPRPAASSPAMFGYRALVVAPHKLTRDYVRYLAPAWGLRMEPVNTVREGVAKFREALTSPLPYSAVVLDAGLADARLFEQLNGAPLVWLATRLELSALSGAALVITKPVRQEQLRRSLEKALGIPQSSPLPGVDAHAQARAALPVSDGEHRVLIAEDNPVNQRLAQRLLQKLGYLTEIVSNGYEAVQALDKTSFDLVLMDCQMPEMDGYEATRRIRLREAGRSHIPVIAMTANAMAGDREKCLDAGMDDYVTKPINLQHLAEALDKWTSNNPAARPG